MASTFVQFKGGVTLGQHGEIWINPDHVLYVQEHPQGALVTVTGQKEFNNSADAGSPYLVPHTILILEPATDVVAKLQAVPSQ